MTRFTIHKSRTLLAAATLLLLCCAYSDSHAQSTPPSSKTSSSDSSGRTADNQDSGDDDFMGAPQREFAYRAYLARAEAEHKQNLKRAADALAIARHLDRTFRKQPALDADGLKEVERLEKLVRRVRGYAGGSDDGAATFVAPATIGESLTRLTEAVARLQREVERTPRRVVAAKVINDANEVIALTRRLRDAK